MLDGVESRKKSSEMFTLYILTKSQLKLGNFDKCISINQTKYNRNTYNGNLKNNTALIRIDLMTNKQNNTHPEIGQV